MHIPTNHIKRAIKISIYGKARINVASVISSTISVPLCINALLSEVELFIFAYIMLFLYMYSNTPTCQLNSRIPGVSSV